MKAERCLNFGVSRVFSITLDDERVIENIIKKYLRSSRWRRSRERIALSFRFCVSSHRGDRLHGSDAMQHLTIRGERNVRGIRITTAPGCCRRPIRIRGRRDSNVHLGILVGAIPRGASSTDDPVHAEKPYQQFVRPYVENWKHPDPQRFGFMLARKDTSASVRTSNGAPRPRRKRSLKAVRVC